MVVVSVDGKAVLTSVQLTSGFRVNCTTALALGTTAFVALSLTVTVTDIDKVLLGPDIMVKEENCSNNTQEIAGWG
jgi:hypothetical protein